MKNTVKFIFAFFAVFVAVGAANLQAVTSGTIGFSVSVPNAVDLRSNGAATGSDGGFSTSQSQTSNDALAVTLTLLDASSPYAVTMTLAIAPP